MRVYFETYGCSLNASDTEVMKGLASERHTLVADPALAEVVIINSCTVKGPTENKILRRMQDLEKMGRTVVLAGCIPQADKRRFKDKHVIGTTQIRKITDVLARIEGRQRAEQYLSTEQEIRLNLPKIRNNPLVEIIPVCRGCLSACAYCKTKFARGGLMSYDEEDIVTQAAAALRDGVKEIWLTSQDNGCYGFDKGTNLAKLLKRICLLDGDYRIRVGMANPQHVQGFVDELVDAFADPKVFRFLHIPVQSGSDAVLKAMERGHTVRDFEQVVRRFRQAYPDMTIATDIICGHPGESEEDFQKTLDLMRRVKPDVVNISRFWSRPGTKAHRMEHIPAPTIRNRTAQLAGLIKEISTGIHKRYIGKTVSVLIDEKGKARQWKGRTDNYKQAIVEGAELSGKRVDATVVSSSAWDIRCEIIEKKKGPIGPKE